MSRNTLKVIACISMLADHAGYILFPQADFLRYIGRIALPVFAFFIGEGCLYTRNIKKYFYRIFSLGVVCQLFYVGEYLFSKQGDPFYLNILLTFSVSVILCAAFVHSCRESEKGRKSYIFGFLLAVVILVCYLSREKIIPVYFDYGLGGIILPVFAASTKDRKKKFFIFAAGLVLCTFSFRYTDQLWTVSTLLSLIPLGLYNGKPGRKNLQKAFYLFYPIHLGALYLISFFL